MALKNKTGRGRSVYLLVYLLLGLVLLSALVIKFTVQTYIIVKRQQIDVSAEATALSYDFPHYFDIFFSVALNDVALNNFIYVVSLGFLYFIPSFVADSRGHHDRFSILLSNLIFGWTGVGWLASFVWSLLSVEGVGSMADSFGRKAAPRLEQLKSEAFALNENVQQHPLTKQVIRKAERVVGTRLRPYVPPPEGTPTLLTNLSVVRDLEGSVNLRAELALPLDTQVETTIIEPIWQRTIFSSQTRLERGGVLHLQALRMDGRPLPGGVYRISIATLPFEFDVQDESVLDAVGEHGKSLPHSATLPVDAEFPNYGREVIEDKDVTLPEITLATEKIEALKTATVSSETAALITVEDRLRDRFAARLDEKVIPTEPWAVEQVGASRWIVSLRFVRRGRPQVARWELTEGDAIRCLDPDARAMSGIP